MCVCVSSRQKVLKWALKEPSVLRLSSNPACLGISGLGVGVFVWVSEYAQGKVKTKSTPPTYLITCATVWAFPPPERLHFSDWQLNLCLFSSVDLFVFNFVFLCISKAARLQSAGKHFPLLCPAYKHYTKYYTLTLSSLAALISMCFVLLFSCEG